MKDEVVIRRSWKGRGKVEEVEMGREQGANEWRERSITGKKKKKDAAKSDRMLDEREDSIAGDGRVDERHKAREQHRETNLQTDTYRRSLRAVVRRYI